MSKKIVLTGGGTAGHITPNIALLPELEKAGYEVFYIGSYDGMEKRLMADYHIPYYGIATGKFRRYFDLKNFSDPFRVLKGFSEARKILKELQPDVVFSKGGFVSVPVVRAAASLKIPCVIHESDMTPGLANKLCIPSAVKVCCNFPETVSSLPADKAVLTGTPIRQELMKGDKEAGRQFCGFTSDKPVLMVIGGSLGALTGMYMGPAGMVVGGMIGNATYTPFRNLNVNWRTNKGLREAGAATRSYANSPLDVKVYSDLNGKSVPEQMKVIDIVSRDFAKSLEKDGKLEQIFNDDLVNDAAMRESRKALLKKYNIKDAQGYESAVNRLRNEFSGTAKAIITEKETRMLERCAGEQYVNLSEKSKKRIMDKVIGSRDIALDNQLRTTLNVYLPKKWEDSFLR